MREVVLVDSSDNQTGLMEIYQAHANPGILHRAISVLLFNDNNQVLLQKRSLEKPLWPDFWSNTVCTHPFDGEGYIDCAVRRLDQELGIKVSTSVLDIVYRFEYQADYNQQLSEHELDTVIVGKYHGEVIPVKVEVSDYVWLEWEKVQQIVNTNKSIQINEKESLNQQNLTPWFQLIVRSNSI